MTGTRALICCYGGRVTEDLRRAKLVKTCRDDLFCRNFARREVSLNPREDWAAGV